MRDEKTFAQIYTRKVYTGDETWTLEYDLETNCQNATFEAFTVVKIQVDVFWVLTRVDLW
jgi:hypothetical protein